MPVSRRIHSRPSREACSSMRIRIARPSFCPRASGCTNMRFTSPYPAGYGEVKRMFVHPEARGQKLGRAILMRIEEQASREGLEWMRLETGIHQAAALALYRHAGYAERGPFGEYAPDPLSHFFEKSIDPGSKRRPSRGR